MVGATGAKPNLLPYRSPVTTGPPGLGWSWLAGVHGRLLRDPRGHPRDAMPWYSQDVNQRALDAYKIVLYRQDDGSWVAEVPAISGCFALMPTREEALAELGHVF